MGQSLEQLLDAAMREGAIDDAQTAAVRRALYGGGGQVGEAFRLFVEADSRRRAPSREWSRLFVEAALDVALNETAPQGYFSLEKAQKMMSALDGRGPLRVDTALEALIAIVEKATQVPAEFSAFVLRHLKEAAIYSDGETASGRKLTPGAVGASELALIRRVVWGAGEEGRLAVSRAEAEALFDIADATAGADNTPDWDAFFAGAVGNYLIGATGRTPPSRERAFEMWDTPVKRDALGFFGQIFSRAWEGRAEEAAGDLARHRLSAMVEESYRRDNEARAAAIEEAEALVGEKADWLVERVRRNGRMTAPESALARFLEREARELPAALRDMAREARG